MLAIKLISLLVLISCSTANNPKREVTMEQRDPLALKLAHKITQLGDTRVDNYHWLRDKNWQKFIQGDLDFDNPKVKEYLDQEIAYTKSNMADTKSIQAEVYKEVLGRMKDNEQSYPAKYKDYYYYTREVKEKNYPYYCRKKITAGAQEEIYFNVNKEAEGKKFYQLKGGKVSQDNKYYAYAFNLTGSLAGIIKVRDLDTGKDFSWEIPNTTASFVWDNDNKHVFYTLRAKNGRGKAIYRVNIFDGPKSKELIFSKPKNREKMFMGVGLSNSERFLSISMSEQGSNEIYLIDLASKQRKPKRLALNEAGVEYSYTHVEKYIYILTNHNKAHDFKVMRALATSPEKKNWKEFLKEKKGIYKESISGFKNYLILNLKNNDLALPQIQIIDLRSNEKRNISFKEDAYDIRFEGAMEFDTDTVRYFYQSPVTPRETIDYNLETGKSVVKKRKEVPTYKPENYEVKREFALGHDGVKVPLTIMYKKGLKKDGSNKVYQYAYGSYGYAMSAYFSAYRISMLERGFIFVIAHVRGGSDKGHKWYLDGKMMKKKNTFHDFISVSEHMIKRGYTSKNRIVANGGSAGGLLMGAIANMRPDLYCGVIADVAFVDVLNTISDASLPLTPPEWVEWGNPLKNKKHYDYIKSYSPYDNIKAQNYPAMLFNTGISDEQVTYWEPTKMVAKLREMRTDSNLLLLNMKMHSGHGGASKKHEGIKEYAFSLAFALKACEK